MASRKLDKTFLGFVLKHSPNLRGVWMNDDAPGDPFICISHRKVWTITVGVNGQKFEAEGPTEAKARINFAAKISSISDAINSIRTWAKRG
jgi:hypothetical protein